LLPGEGRPSRLGSTPSVELPHDPAGYGMLRAFTAIRDAAGAVIINRLAAGRFDAFRGGRGRDPARPCTCKRRNSNSTGKLEECDRIFSDGNFSTTPICLLQNTLPTAAFIYKSLKLSLRSAALKPASIEQSPPTNLP